jgi:RNA polymerase sigma-70 factor (family 1)
MNTLQEVKNGSQDAFVTLYREYSPRLYNFINSVVRSKYDAQDILQSTFLKIWEKRADIDLELNFESFIYTVARNYCISHLRSKLYAQLISIEGCEKGHEDVMQEVLDNDNAKYIKGIIDLLPERRREIFILSRVSEMTYKQIANHLGISENTVDTQMRRALSFLKEKLSREQFIFICLLSQL